MPDEPIRSKQAPRYETIANELREEILAGRYGRDGRMPSEANLVDRFGASRPTVAKALRLLGEEGLVERRVGSGSFVKSDARKEARGNWLAFLVPNLGNTEIFQMIGGEIGSLARMHEFGLIWGGSDHPPGDPRSPSMEQLCRQFIDRNVAGVFFAPYELLETADEANHEMAVMLRDAGIPVVLLDRDLTSFPRRSDFDLVGVDNFAGGYLMAEHLIKLGCRTIRFVARPRSASTVDARLAGVREALARHHLSCDAGMLRIGALEDPKFVRDLTTINLPDAYVCANDHTAAMLMQALQRAKVRVPEQVRVVGFDDVKFATLVTPPLTTIQQPCREIAQTAFRAMMDRLGDATLPARHQMLAPRLAIRDSCGAYLPKKP
ncbi:MAG: GntR family transcriptional regulator [Verrucomicrobiae bacterium]|nr:GntR family transcriptional regulator [Verrucomicrobiae bacterium]